MNEKAYVTGKLIESAIGDENIQLIRRTFGYGDNDYYAMVRVVDDLVDFIAEDSEKWKEFRRRFIDKEV